MYSYVQLCTAMYSYVQTNLMFLSFSNLFLSEKENFSNEGATAQLNGSLSMALVGVKAYKSGTTKSALQSLEGLGPRGDQDDVASFFV
jgi:hypothetical protein